MYDNYYRHNWFLYNKQYKIGYLPILRNGNTFFKQAFSRWQLSDIEESGSSFSQYKVSMHDVEEFFCPIRHPKERWISGIAEILHVHHPGILTVLNKLDINSIGDIKTGLFIFKTYHDDHLYPIYYLYKEIYDKIQGIPMDHEKKNTNELLTEYFREKNIDIILEKDARLHISGDGLNKTKEKLNALLNHHLIKTHYKKYIEPFYEKDLILYKKAHERFN